MPAFHFQGYSLLILSCYCGTNRLYEVVNSCFVWEGFARVWIFEHCPDLAPLWDANTCLYSGISGCRRTRLTRIVRIRDANMFRCGQKSLHKGHNKLETKEKWNLLPKLINSCVLGAVHSFFVSNAVFLMLS